MRKAFLIAAAAIMIPGAASAQSTGGQADTSTMSSAPADNMGDTQNPVASDTHLDQRSGMKGSSGSASDTSGSATASDAAATMPSASGTAADTSAMGDSAMTASTDASSPGASMNKSYPTCSRAVQDSCRNRGGK